jgi:two-component system, NtrC family, response regulator HydG
LRVLQEKEITRVGGNQAIKVDFRAVAATNKDLPTLVKEGTFRPDLYYRLDVFGITLPPLRERKEDIPLLVDHFLHKYSHAMNKRFTGISRASLDVLMNYQWPGNVRELENAIERAMVIGREPEIQASDFPLQAATPPAPEGSLALEDIERVHIQHVLEVCDWNQTRAAKALGIDRVTLYNKIKKFGFRKADAASQ